MICSTKGVQAVCKSPKGAAATDIIMLQKDLKERVMGLTMFYGKPDFTHALKPSCKAKRK